MESIKEVHECVSWLTWVFVDDLDVELTCRIRTPILLDALLYELVDTELRVMILSSKVWPCPHIRNMISSMLISSFLAHAQHQQGILILKLFKVKHCNW